MSKPGLGIGESVMVDGELGYKCIACDCGGADKDCFFCEGEGKLYQLIAPEHEIAAIFANIEAQMPGRKH